MRRREFICLLGGAAATARPLTARAQQAGRIPRVGALWSGPENRSTASNGFDRGLRELGYVEGQNIAIERRYGGWTQERLYATAAELVGLKPDVIVAWSTTVALVAKRATSSIPIVGAIMADPVGDGLVASLARPGGNITGTTFLGPELVAKRLQLLRDVLPHLIRVAALWHPTAYGERTMAGIRHDIEAAARTLGMQLQLVPAASPDDLADAFSAMTAQRAEAFIVLPSPMMFNQYGRIVKLAAKDRLPSMYQSREAVDLGGLMSYGASIAELARRSAGFVDRILKGARPAELPVEQPTSFELVINLKTARALDLTVSRDLLLVADDVIE
jgi:putative ABC transport system substrate-binding protein